MGDGIDYFKWAHSKSHTRQLQSVHIAVSGSGHTRKQIDTLTPVVHRQEGMHTVLKSASQVVLSRMQLTVHATR